MGQQLQAGRLRTSASPFSARTWSADSEKLWLPMLIDAMEKAVRPECRSTPCDRLVLAAVSAHLAQPALADADSASRFSLRN